MIHKNSDLPASQIDNIDLHACVALLPVEIIYQAQPIDDLVNFFKVKHLKDETILQARMQFEGLSKQVETITKSMEADFKNNKVTINIDAPTLVIPYK